jgi:hypothetical protein
MRELCFVSRVVSRVVVRKKVKTFRTFLSFLVFIAQNAHFWPLHIFGSKDIARE